MDFVHGKEFEIFHHETCGADHSYTRQEQLVCLGKIFLSLDTKLFYSFAMIMGWQWKNIVKQRRICSNKKQDKTRLLSTFKYYNN